jgi:hypothetical protein
MVRWVLARNSVVLQRMRQRQQQQEPLLTAAGSRGMTCL